MLLIASPLVGYSFIQAGRLYAEASRSAMGSADAARALAPLDGVLVPTFGACYLALTLLWPFVAIRSIGAERECGSLKLLLQLPMRREELVAVKACAAMIASLALFAPTLCALGAWTLQGGHLAPAETLNLFLGYSLYAFSLTGLAFLAAAVSESVSTAAIVALALTLGSWIIDFTYGADAGFLKWFSLTSALREFEHGLLPLGQSLHLLTVGLAAFALSGVWLAPSALSHKLRGAVAVIVVAAALLAAITGLTRAWDVSEDRRNSFKPAEEIALAALPEPLRLTIHLSSEDSRFKDLQRNILDKLRRLVPRLSVTIAGSPEDRDYGWIIYEYAGRTDRSTSNSEEEILPIIHGLAGQKVPAERDRDYPGYPLAADPGGWAVLFYGVLPGLIALTASGVRGHIDGLNLRRIKHAIKVD